MGEEQEQVVIKAGTVPWRVHKHHLGALPHQSVDPLHQRSAQSDHQLVVGGFAHASTNLSLLLVVVDEGPFELTGDLFSCCGIVGFFEKFVIQSATKSELEVTNMNASNKWKLFNQ